MHTARGGDLNPFVRPRPETAWRCAVRDAERSRERFVRLVTGVESDLGDCPRFVAQPPRRALEPEPPRQFERRLANHPAEDAMEVKGRETREARQCLQFERIVEVLDDVLDCSLHGSHIEGAGVGPHLCSL
jgi:hypothetical protein